MKQILFITYLHYCFFPNNRLSNHRWWSKLKKDYWVKAESQIYGRNSFLWNSTYFKRYKVKHEESVQNNGLSLNLVCFRIKWPTYFKDWLFHYKADGRRIAVDSQLGNVITLKGTDATDDRVNH
jgi:hypothetical protein